MHSNAQPGGESLVKEGGDHARIRYVLLALSETFSQATYNVFVILQQSLQYLIVFEDVFIRENLRKVIKDVEGSNIKFMNSQDCWVTAYDEWEHPEARNPVSHSDRKLPVKILSASQGVVLLV